MILQIVDVGPKYLDFFGKGHPYGAIQQHNRRILEDCKKLFPNFDEPYFRITGYAITLKGEWPIQIVVSFTADYTTIDRLVENFEDHLNHPIFGNRNYRNMLNFEGHDYNELFERLSQEYEILRKELS